MAKLYAQWRAELLRSVVHATTILGMFIAGVATAANEVTTLSQQAIDQITALLAEKETRSDLERKIDSQLLYTARMERGLSAAPGVATLDTGINPDASGRVDVEIRSQLTPELQQAIKAAGGEIVRAFAFANTVEARLPLSGLQDIAALPSVSFIAPKAQGMTTRAVNPSYTDRSKQPAVGAPAEMLSAGADGKKYLDNDDGSLSPRLERFRETVKRALDTAKIGSRNSEGDRAHRANDARSAFGVSGAGLRIGVLSDSFNNLSAAAADVTSGDLPGPGNPNGFTTAVGLAGSGDLASGGSDEGRAMLQIVHDLAPGATLYFATAFNSITDFANNIRALRGIATSPAVGNISPGCDIIIDDIFYFTETGLHDGQTVATNRNMAVVTQAVNDVTANGAMYFSSAGNSGNLAQATSGAWEGDFTSGAKPAIITGTGDALIWSGTDVGNTITSGTNAVSMQWSDPVGGSTNDYDLFRLNSTLTTVLASSTNVQTGTQDPYEELTAAANTRLVVVRRAGAAARFISLSTNRGRLQYGTNGQIRGHSGAANGYAVAATPAVSPGPTSGPFVAANVTETFSSDGPRRVFYAANGSAITAGNFLAATNGGVLRAKPDLTAADGVATTLPAASGLNPFYGTSAAAPHLGAIAALVKQGAPSATTTQIRNFLTSTALDIMGAGVDVTSGPGIAQAFQAVQATGAVPMASLGLGTVSVSGDNNRVDPSDCNTLTIALVNNGALNATAVSAVLTTSTPGVSIAQGNSPYSNIAAAGSQNNTVPFSVSTSAVTANGATINFTLTVTYTGGTSPTVLNFTLPLGVDVNNYGFTATTGATIPAGGVLAAGSAADDAVVTVTTPFAFSIYGTPVTSGQTITVSTNGNIQLVTSGGSSSEVNDQLPSGTFANVSVLVPFWDDLLLTTSGGGIFTNTVGTAPNRQFVIEWRGRRFNDGATTQNINFAVVFNEASNDFRYLYAQTGIGVALNGVSATVGVQKGNAASAKFAQYSLNQGVITPGLILTAAVPTPTPGTGACFAPATPPALSYAPTTGTTVAFTGVTTVGSTGSGVIAVTPSSGSGSGAASTSTVNGCTLSGADAANFVGAGSVNLSFVGTTTTAQNINLSCTSGSAARSASLSCNETLGTGAATLRSWPLSCPLGASAPQFSYVPTTGTTVTATGGALVGSTGALSITPSVATAGSGSGPSATTTVTCTPPTGAFSGFGQSVSATGTGAISGGPLSGSCTLGTTAQTQTLSCSENRGGTLVPVSWTIACPLGNSPPQFGYVPAAGSTVAATGGSTVGSTGALSITPSIATSGSGSGATATTTLTCTPPTAPFSGFAQSVTATSTGAISGGPLSGSCTLGSSVQTQTLSCNESRGGVATPVSWTLSCGVGTAPPALSYNPTTGATVAFTGVSTVGSTGTGVIAVTPSAGFGSGAASTSTVNGCTVAGADAASFAGAGSVNLSFVGATTTAQNIALTCTSGSAARSATLSCNETLGTGAVAARTWPLSCPVGAAAPQFGYAPSTGTTVTATGGNAVGSTAAMSITPTVATVGSGSGAAATTTLTCTPPTGAFSGFAQTVTATGTGAISGGPLSGSCTLAATAQTQTLSCTENRGGTATPVSWTLSCGVGNSPPALAYNPTTGATIAFTGVTIVSSTGVGAIAVTPSGGSGAGTAATSTINSCTFSGADAASFAGAGSMNLSFVGTTTTAQNLSLSCTSGSAVRAATLTCNETLGAGPATPRSWPLACPVACSLDLNGDGLVSVDKDGVLLSRYLQGFRGAGLITDVVLGAARADAQAVETFIGNATQFDVFGRPAAAATSMQDGLLLVRLMLGVSDIGLLGGITIPTGAQFTSAAAIRANVNARCGTAF